MASQVTGSACLHCNAEIEQPRTGRPRRYCSSSCRTMAYKRRQLNIDATLADLHAEADGVCYLCGDTINLEVVGMDGPSIDHELASINGGGNRVENIRITHLRCNVTKCGRVLCPHCDRPLSA